MKYFERILGKIKVHFNSWHIVFLYGVIFSGVTLATITLIVNRNFWYDEAMLALNIVNRPIAELLTPLDYDQVAPVGFLIFEKLITMILGENDWVFRIIPFFCFLASIPFLTLLSKKIFKFKDIALFVVAVFSVNTTIIYYSSETKQYSSDVLICIILSLLAWSFIHNKNKKNLRLLWITGLVAFWISYATVFIIPAIALLSLTSSTQNKATFRKTLAMVFSWGVSFLTYYYLYIYQHPTREMMIDFWEFSFLPLNPISTQFLIFLKSHIHTFFIDLLGFNSLHFIPVVAILLSLYTLVINKRWSLLILLVSPILIHLIASGLKVYPFYLRLYLYYTPLLIILFAYGIESGINLVSRTKSSIITRTIVSVVAIVVLWFQYSSFKLKGRDVTESMEYLERSMQDNEMLLIHGYLVPQFQFYKGDFSKLWRFRIYYGSNETEDWSRYRQIVNDSTNSVWHVYLNTYHRTNDSINEVDYIKRLLNKEEYESVKTISKPLLTIEKYLR